MDCSVKTISEKHLIGLSTRMSLTNNKTAELWQTLMARRKEIENRVDQSRYSVQIFGGLTDFSKFTPETVFKKWAAFEVKDFEKVPQGMETHILSGGEYAVFIHKGTPETFPKTMRFIMMNWLPNSGYSLDDREHFEVLGESYRRDDPSAEEEVWIPIRNRFQK